MVQDVRPDTWEEIRAEGLGYFAYSLTEKGRKAKADTDASLETLIAEGLVQFQRHPLDGALVLAAGEGEALAEFEDERAEVFDQAAFEIAL